MERFGGMISPVSFPEFATDVDGKQVIKGYQVYPIACESNADNCFETGAHKHFEPDSSKAAIGFFVDNGGCSLISADGAKGGELKFSFDLKFLCWMNGKRLGSDITGDRCLPSGRVVPYVIAQLFGDHTATGLFSGGIEETAYQGIEVTKIRELTKTPSMFEPFTFARDGINRQLFTNPYDYFGLQISGTFVVLKNCLDALGAAWVAETDVCI